MNAKYYVGCFRIDPTVSIIVSVLKQINMTLFVVGTIIWHYQDPMMIPEAWEKESRGAIDCSLTFQEEVYPLTPYFYSVRCPRMILRAPKFKEISSGNIDRNLLSKLNLPID